MSKNSCHNIQKRLEELESENQALKDKLSLLNDSILEDNTRFFSNPVVKGVIDSISEALYVQDREGRFLDVNLAAERTYNYPKDFFIGKTPAVLAAPGMNDIEAVKLSVKKAYEGEPQSFEFWGIDKNGNIFPNEVNLTQCDYCGQQAVIAVARDISERKDAENALRESKENLHITLESIGDAVIATDMQGNITMMNRVAEKLVGYTFDEVNDKDLGDIFKIVNSKSRETVKNPVKTVLQNGKVAGLANDTVLINRAGKEYQIADTAAPITDHEGNMQGVILVFNDVTDKYLANEKIKESERMLTTLIGNLPGVVYRCVNDEYWTMKYISAGITELTGYKTVDLVNNRKISFVEIIYEDDIGRINNEVQKALLEDNQFAISYRIKDIHGSIKWVWEQGRGISDNDGNILSIEGFITDISDRVSQEEKIRDQTAKINAIIKTMPDLLFIMDEYGFYVDVFAPGSSKLSMSENNLVGYNLKDVFPARDVKRFLKAFDECLRSGDLQTVDYQMVVDDKQMFFEAKISPLDEKQVLFVARDITDRKQTEKALRAAEENFRRSLDESPLGTRIVTLNGKTIYANQALLDIYGYDTMEELANTSLKKRYTPESYTGFLARNKMRKSGEGGPSEYEVSIIRKSGDIRHLVVYRKKILWDGKSQYMVIYQDITQQKLAVEALHRSEERFRSLYENSSIGLYRTTPGGDILLANPALVRMLGYESFEELKSVNLSDRHFSGETPRHEFVKKMESQQELTGHESGWKHKDGSIIYVRESAKVVKDNQGRTIYYDGTVEDITQYKYAKQALQESEEKFRALVENAFEGIYLVKDRHYEYVNDKFCEITGYSRDELTNEKFDFGVMLTGESGTIVENWHNARKKGEKRPTVYETQIKTKTGIVLDVEIMTMGLEIAGQFRVLGIIRDITDRKQSQKLKEEVAVAKRSLNFKRNFLANMSHEIRTPLTGVIGMADILAKTRLSPHQREYLNSLRYSSENLREIINQILDYSKIEAGELMIKPRNFSLLALLENAEKHFESICYKNISLEKFISPEFPEYIYADEQRVYQIIYNLISNAVKFTDEGKIALRIRPESAIDTNNPFLIRVEVEDTGIGIRSEVQKNLFKPFSQIDQGDTRDFEGTGLGLSICKELSRILGGQINVKSTSGVGSLFWFTFRAEIVDKQIKELELKSHGASKKPRALKILFVEDKIINQKVVVLLLKSMGHKVFTAINGKEAIDKYSPGKYDLILMDIQMPVMDGITATQKLKEKYDDLPPIVGLSANAFEGDREKYMKQGMDEYITKPLKEEEFDQVLKKLGLRGE